MENRNRSSVDCVVLSAKYGNFLQLFARNSFVLSAVLTCVFRFFSDVPLQLPVSFECICCDNLRITELKPGTAQSLVYLAIVKSNWLVVRCED